MLGLNLNFQRNFLGIVEKTNKKEQVGNIQPRLISKFEIVASLSQNVRNALSYNDLTNFLLNVLYIIPLIVKMFAQFPVKIVRAKQAFICVTPLAVSKKERAALLVETNSLRVLYWE